MGELVINYSGIDQLISCIDQAKQNYANRISFLNRSKGKIGGVSTSRGYLGLAVTELYNRNSKISEKVAKLDAFRKNLDDFKTEAEEADQRVADRISQNTGNFCYTMGIEMTSPLGSWWKGVCNDVEAWYNENKEVIWATVTLVVDVAFCALAVVAFIATLPASGFAICLAVGAGFALAKSVSDVITSGASLYCYAHGDKEGGSEWAERELQDGFLYVGRAADDMMGTGDFCEGVASLAYGGLEVCSVICTLHDLKDLGKGLLKTFRLDTLSWGNIFNRSWAQNKAWFKSIDWSSRFLSGSNWKDAAMTVVGLGTTPYGSSADYQDFKTSFTWLANTKAVTKVTGLMKLPSGIKTSTVTSLLKFKTYGDNFKTVYDAVSSIFDGDSSTRIWTESGLGGTLSGLVDDFGSGLNNLSGGWNTAWN